MARLFGDPLAPFARAAAVTPSDSTDLSGCRGIYVGGAGNLSVRMRNGGNTVVFTAPPVGTVLHISIDRVMAATTATLLIALY